MTIQVRSYQTISCHATRITTLFNALLCQGISGQVTQTMTITNTNMYTGINTPVRSSTSLSTRTSIGVITHHCAGSIRCISIRSGPHHDAGTYNYTCIHGLHIAILITSTARASTHTCTGNR